MKITKYILTALMLLIVSTASFSQDKRTIETKVADLLARFPANDLQLTNRLMDDMLSMGEPGWKLICDKIVPAGTGDDTPQRFGIETMSRFLSQKGKEQERLKWEDLCLAYVKNSNDNGVKDFFMKQLQIAGGSKSAEAMKVYLTNKDLCEPAAAVIAKSDPVLSQSIFAEALKNKDLPCAATLMNHLAISGSDKAVNEYAAWASSANQGVRTSAYNALAMSGNKIAEPVLLAAAKAASYKWEPTAAVEALLNYADAAAGKGNVKGSDKITKLVMANCDESSNIHYKTKALEIYTRYHGIAAMKMLQSAAAHQDKKYRTAAMMISLEIPNKEAIKSWVAYYPKANAAAKPELISFLGKNGDASAIQLVTSALADQDPLVRKEAAAAIAKLNGKKAVPALASYISNFSDMADQDAGKAALMTVLDNSGVSELLPVLKDGNKAAKATVIDLIGWNSDNRYFSLVLENVSASEPAVRMSALRALKNLASPENQEQIMTVLNRESEPVVLAELQAALSAAALRNNDAGKRSEVILKTAGTTGSAEFRKKILPVLAKTGGREALELVSADFKNGNSEMKSIAFNSLINWNDHSASSSLFDIIASGSGNYVDPAFEGYVRQIRNARITDDQKLLLLRKIMPYADTPDKKKKIFDETGRIKTYPALFYVGTFLDDQAVSADAARAAMNIALPATGSSAGLYGTIVRTVLQKAAVKLKGAESDYEKEMINKYLASMPADEGFVSMFNGKDLSGWQGLVENPVTRAKMKPAVLAKKQLEANKKVPLNWSVKDGMICFSGNGDNLCSIKEYGDFEMYVDWKISKDGDSGIYLRGTPQVQIWDTSRTDVGAQVGSGGLYNNQKNPAKPLKVADNPIGDWNTFRIVMTGEKVSAWLNGELVADNVTLENYWDRNIPIFPKGAIELQAHGTDLAFRDIYVREISDSEYNLTPEEKAEGFVTLFNGKNLNGWTGNKSGYVVEDGNIIVKPGDGSGGNLYTEKEYADFIFRFEFQLTPGANNGLGIRAPLTGDAAYQGMELQILDDTAPVYAELQPYQYHGSVYGVIPAKKGHQKPVGEWNYEEVKIVGSRITITLNGTVIVDGDISGPRDNGTMDHKDHPGLKNTTGHIGFLGHGSELKFRNIRIKDLTK